MRCAALRGAADAEREIALRQGIPDAERGARNSRSKTLSEIAAFCERAVNEHIYKDGHRPRTFKTEGSINLTAYGAAALWGRSAATSVSKP